MYTLYKYPLHLFSIYCTASMQNRTIIKPRYIIERNKKYSVAATKKLKRIFIYGVSTSFLSTFAPSKKLSE